MRTPFAHIATLLILVASPPVIADAEILEKSFTAGSGTKYSVRVVQGVPSQLSRHPSKQFGYWGTEEPKPSLCVVDLTVTRRGRPIPVLAKHFYDLCNVHYLELSESKGRVIATLNGGDAADGYAAEFHFRGVQMIERLVLHGEFPETNERTLIHRARYEK